MGLVQEASPDPPSEPEKVTVTLVLFQPFELDAGNALALADGAVLSILMPVCVSVDVCPALSVQVPVAVVC